MEYTDYKVGDDFKGKKIKSIISRSTNAMVYIAEDESIAYAYQRTNFQPESVINQFHRLDSRLPQSIPLSLYKRLQRELGASLYSALVSENVDSALEKFVLVDERLKRVKEPEEAKALMVVTSLVLSLVLAALLLLLFEVNFMNNDTIFLAMSAGVTGSFFSLISRNKKVELNLLGKRRYILIQSATISVTGAIAGLIVFIFSKSNIAFGFAANDLYTLLTICIAAGFSERLIPDLFSKITDESLKSSID